MAKETILYESAGGHTAQYAELLYGELGIPACRLGEEKLDDGTPVVFLSWLCGGRIKGLKKAKRHYLLRAVGAVGMGKGSERYLSDIKNRNSLSSVPVFYLQGGFEMDKIHGMHKFLMKVMRAFVGKKLRKKANRTAEEDATLEMLEKGKSYVERANLEKLVAFLQQKA